ncbi:Rpn family recombination-promoting nuclease/putative transposase [Bacillus andreraoultii]|uniref:Rpn family recombination-promoting nuclease/putative transposase n=1 Tax=Bacillus andreraoultii TaxID=1499685 RepID=UPI00067E70BD|nr:Rpn family recombination-promoting nuclease/putative transposase [Bacillus andreraoultii]
MWLKNPHDKFFKEPFGDVTVTKDFLTNYLPESIMEMIDVNTLEPEKDRFINEKLKENFSDLLFKVNICGNEGYLYLS